MTMCCLHVYLFESGAGACSGDSGGPFVCPNQVSMLMVEMLMVEMLMMVMVEMLMMVMVEMLIVEKSMIVAAPLSAPTKSAFKINYFSIC